MIVSELKPNLPAMSSWMILTRGRQPIPITLTDSVQVALALPCHTDALLYHLFGFFLAQNINCHGQKPWADLTKLGSREMLNF